MGTVGRFVLKCRDTELLVFEFSRDYFGTLGLQIIEWNHAAAHLMPWGIGKDENSFYQWLSARALPRNRKNAEKLCYAVGLNIHDVSGMCAFSLGLSLNDSFWTPREGDERHFQDVNLYGNGFSTALASVAYTGQLAGKIGAPELTPEFATDGTLRKAWRIDGAGSRVLYKGASNGWVPGEPLSELISSYIARRAGLDSMRYELDSWYGETCSVCECFCSESVAYEPFARATGISDLGTALAFCARLGEEPFEALRDMLVFDCLVLNRDRHFSNFGLLRSPVTGDVIALAPIFDNGRALLPAVPTAQLGDTKFRGATMAPAFGGSSFDVLASRVMGPRQHEWLLGLANLDLAPLADKYAGTPFHAEVLARCEGLEGLLRARARELARIEPLSLEEMRPMLERAWEAGKSHWHDRLG